MKIEDNDWINEIYLKVTIQDLEEENKKLKEELKKYKKLHKYSNWELLTYSCMEEDTLQELKDIWELNDE